MLAGLARLVLPQNVLEHHGWGSCLLMFLVAVIGVSAHGPFWVLYRCHLLSLMCLPRHALQMKKNLVVFHPCPDCIGIRSALSAFMVLGSPSICPQR